MVQLKSVLFGTALGGRTDYAICISLLAARNTHDSAGHISVHSAAEREKKACNEDEASCWHSNALLLLNENLEQLAVVQFLCRTIMHFFSGYNQQSTRCMELECLCVRM